MSHHLVLLPFPSSQGKLDYVWGGKRRYKEGRSGLGLGIFWPEA